MLDNTGGNNHSPKITPTTPAFGSEPAREPLVGRTFPGDESGFSSATTLPQSTSGRDDKGKGGGDGQEQKC
jgi:hypothetical protein